MGIRIYDSTAPAVVNVLPHAPASRGRKAPVHSATARFARAFGIALAALGGCAPARPAPREASPRGPALLPGVSQRELREGSFRLNESSAVFDDTHDEQVQQVAALFRGELLRATGRDVGKALFRYGNGPGPHAIDLILREPARGEERSEAYALVVGDSALISAAHARGLIWGMQSFLQMLDPSTRPPSLQAGTTTDAPAYPWRGLLLDPARHMLDLDFLRRTLRVMSAYKMNVLHLHLVDDGAWRFELKSYPKCHGTGRPFYTRQEIKDLVAYAANLGIEIVPEFDFPGHSLAAVNAYPELDCEGKTRSGGKEDAAILCPGKAATWTFLESIVSEAAEVFPSKYLHMGGDEPYAIRRWASCSDCQARMKKEGVATLEALYHTYLRDVHAIAKRHGKTVIFWDDAVHPGVEPMPPRDVVIHGWKDFKTVEALARAGYAIVNSSYGPMYLTSHGMGAGFPLEAVVAWDPRHFANPQPKRGAMEVTLIPLPEGSKILGGEACCWATDQDVLERRLYPRLLAAAEGMWSGQPPDRRDPAELRARIAAGHLDRLRAFGVPISEASVGELLFNGKSLAGWVPVKGSEFRAIGGALVATGKGGNGWLRTEKTYRDFALSFDWQPGLHDAAEGDVGTYDSGVFIRCAPDGNPWPEKEIQIAKGDEGHGYFGIPNAPAAPQLIRPKDWNTFEVLARGASLTLIVNGMTAWTTTDPTPKAGHIAFQAEGHAMRFRNIRLRELAP